MRDLYIRFIMLLCGFSEEYCGALQWDQNVMGGDMPLPLSRRDECEQRNDQTRQQVCIASAETSLSHMYSDNNRCQDGSITRPTLNPESQTVAVDESSEWILSHLHGPRYQPCMRYAVSLGCFRRQCCDT